MPVFKPTAKQLESLLKDTERTWVVLGDSIFGRVFMMAMTNTLLEGSFISCRSWFGCEGK